MEHTDWYNSPGAHGAGDYVSIIVLGSAASRSDRVSSYLVCTALVIANCSMFGSIRTFQKALHHFEGLGVSQERG